MGHVGEELLVSLPPRLDPAEGPAVLFGDPVDHARQPLRGLLELLFVVDAHRDLLDTLWSIGAERGS